MRGSSGNRIREGNQREQETNESRVRHTNQRATPEPSANRAINFGGVSSVQHPFIECIRLVYVSSNQSGTEIYIDDPFVTKTPLTLNLKPGQHYVLAFVKNHKNWSQQITVTAGMQAHLKVTLEKAN
jgi:hypothetical protein